MSCGSSKTIRVAPEQASTRRFPAYTFQQSTIQAYICYLEVQEIQHLISGAFYTDRSFYNPTAMEWIIFRYVKLRKEMAFRLSYICLYSRFSMKLAMMF